MTLDHDGYGKRVLREAAGLDFAEYGHAVEIRYGPICARIDGVVGRDIAVEIESRVDKQVRGALLDLVSHPSPRKLLVLLPVHMNNPDATAEMSVTILSHFLEASQFRVVVLKGSAAHESLHDDVLCVEEALRELGYTGRPRE